MRGTNSPYQVLISRTITTALFFMSEIDRNSGMNTVRQKRKSRYMHSIFSQDNDKRQLVAAAVLVLFFVGLSHAQSSKPAATQDSQPTLLTRSMGAIAVDAGPSRSTRSPVIVRKELTESERQAPLDFSIPLKMRNFDELQRRIANGEIISAEEMTAKYYPSAADYQMVVDWLSGKGFEIEPGTKFNLSVFAHGSVAQVELAFETRFARVQFDGNESSSALTAPSLPAAIAARVLGINGLQPHLRPRRHSKIISGQPQKLINNAPPYTVKEISNAYNANGLGLTGSGQKIGIVIDTFPLAADLVQFWQGNGIAQSLTNIEEIQVVRGPLPSRSGEETLDVEWSSGMAPGAKVRVYATTDLAFVHLDEAYQAILNDLPGQPELHQISLSFGLGELYTSGAQMQTDSQYFASLAARGVTILVASGDGGSSPGPNGFGDNSGPVQVESPANDPSVTGIGGTSLYLNSSTGAVASESAWSYSGGGVSTFFGRPSWQTGAGIPAGNYRTVPDVASVADPNTGGYLIFDGQLYLVGGTSWGAPVWAGFCAMINQARANQSVGPLGLIGPKICVLNASSSFRDITAGSNGLGGVYNAGPFYDLCTGLGVANVSSLVQALSFIHPLPSTFLSYSGDFNGDGKQDILWRNTQTGEVDIWFMNGASVVSKARVATVGLDWKVVGTADFNGDGYSDILWQNTVNGSFVIWIMHGSSHSDFEFPSQGNQWSIAGVADLDHSGFADILWRNVVSGELVAWKSAPGLNFSSFYIGTAGLDWNLVGAADLLGNGQSALIWRNQNSGEVAAWQLTGGAISSESILGVVPLNWTIAGFGDFIGDGHQDILWYNASDGSVVAWLMNGFAISPVWIHQGSISQDWQIRATPDVVGNGLNSILWSDIKSGEQVIWIPGGAGISQSSIGFASPPWTVQR
jgi:kumamolisin